VASLGLVSPGAVIAASRKLVDLFKMKKFAIFSLLHTKIEFISKIFRWLFIAFYKKTCHLSHKISHLAFFNHFYPQNLYFYYFTKKNLFIFSSWCHPLRWCHPGRPAPSAPASWRHCKHATVYWFMDSDFHLNSGGQIPTKSETFWNFFSTIVTY